MSRGQLILGEASATVKPKPKATEQCGTVRDNRTKPMNAEDLKAGGAKQIC